MALALPTVVEDPFYAERAEEKIVLRTRAQEKAEKTKVISLIPHHVFELYLLAPIH